MTNIKIRSLHTQDLFDVSKIIAKIGKKAFAEISEETSEDKVGLIIIMTALEHAESDVKFWLADLIEKDVEEFEQMPIETTFDIIEQLQEKQDFTNFLKRAKGLTRIFSKNK